jgi:hypothetical protein
MSDSDLDSYILRLHEEIREINEEIAILENPKRKEIKPSRYKQRKTDNLIRRLIKNYDQDPRSFWVGFQFLNSIF